MINFFTQISTKYPRALIGILAGVTIVLGFGMSKLIVDDDIHSHLPEGADEMVEKLMIEDHFGKKQTVLIGIESEDIYQENTLQKIADISEALKGIKYVMPDRVFSLTTIKTVKNRDGELDAGLFLEKFPSNENEWKNLRNEVLSDELIHGRLVAGNGKFALVSAEIEDGHNALELFHELKSFIEPFQGPEKIYLTGELILGEEINTGIANNTGVLVPLALLGILLGLFFCFGTIRGIVLPMLVVVLCIVWTMGAMGYLGLPITVVSNALPIIMTAVASSYGIHFLFAYYEAAQVHSDKALIVGEVLKKVGMAVIITGTTSAFGAASLMIFNIPSIRHFGIIGAIGILSATVLTLTLLPAFFRLLSVRQGRMKTRKLFHSFIGFLSRIAIERKQTVGWIFFVLTGLAIWGCTKIKVGADITRFFPENHSARMAAEALNENMTGIRLFDVMIDTKQEDGAKDYPIFEKIANFQNYIKTQPGIGHVFSYTNIVNRIHQSLSENDPAIRLSDPNAIAQHLILHEMSVGMEGVQSWVDVDYQRIKMQVFLKTSEPEEHKQLREVIHKEFDTAFKNTGSEIYFGGDVITWIAIIREVVTGKIINIVVALLLVLVICTLLFRNFKKGLLALIPIVFSLLFIFGSMGFLDIRLETSTALLTSMVVGIGIDFAIYYLIRYFSYYENGADNDSAHEKAMQTTGVSISFDVISNVIGFSVLMFSAFVPVRNFGYLLVFSMILIFLCTVLLYPLLLQKLYLTKKT